MISTLLLGILILIKPSIMIDINGENKTIIEPLHSNVTVTTGQKAMLTCIFDTTNHDLSYLSNHQLIWIRQNHASYDADFILAHNQDLLISDHRLNIQRTDIDYSLTITNVNIDDEGSYACEINTQPPQKAIIHLYVQEIPMIIDNATSSPIIINEHENVTMECQARGRPTPYISWFKRNETSLENEILANNTNGQLYLPNVTRHQTGHYECRASNGVHGHVVSKEIQLRVLFNFVLIMSLSLVQTQYLTHHKRPFPASASPMDSDPLIESHKKVPTATTSGAYRANEEQLKQFLDLLRSRLNLKELPNITDVQDDVSIPSIVNIQKQQIQRNEENHTYQLQHHREENQATTERAILPGEIISHHTCQRRIAAKFSLNTDSLHNIDCFRFTKSLTESRSLPTNQTIKSLKVYVKKNFFFFNQEHENIYKPNMFQLFQVYRPTVNDSYHGPLPGFTDTIRLVVNEVKQLPHNWFELTIDTNHVTDSLQQIYQRFLSPWYGLAINHVLQSPWSNFYRRYYSKKHLAGFLRSNSDDDSDYDSKESQEQLPYMLIEYGEKMLSSSSARNRAARHTGKVTPARPCDPKSPCCRRPLTIDLDQGHAALNFVIYPRQLDIGECVGVCGSSGSSSQYISAKNNQHQNKNHAGYDVMRLHQHRNATGAHPNKPDQQSGHCCSYTRTGGLEVIYIVHNGGPIIRKYLPNMVVEECRCGSPATIH